MVESFVGWRLYICLCAIRRPPCNGVKLCSMSSSGNHLDSTPSRNVSSHCQLPVPVQEVVLRQLQRESNDELYTAYIRNL